jgi:peptidyl-prolyl cis-trans isomerase A (cyclophilin A)
MKMLTIITIMIITAHLAVFGQVDNRNVTITIRTEMGDINVELDRARAPVTSANFMSYIDSGLYNNSCFYRVVRMDNQPADSVRIEVIQGGRFKNEENGFAPIAHETTEMTGIKHTDGTISMARSGPGSATSEFFICVGDQPELDFGGKRNPDGQGFAAFGKVIKGMDVVRKIQSISAPDQYLDQPVKIYNIVKGGRYY